MLFDSLKSDPKSWIYSLVLGGIIYYVVKFYYKVKQYPSGPFPLPLIGSIYSKFLGQKKVFKTKILFLKNLLVSRRIHLKDLLIWQKIMDQFTHFG